MEHSSWLASTGGQWTWSDQADPFTKWIGLGYSRPVNYLGWIEHFVQINGSGRPIDDSLLAGFKMKQICTKKLCIIIIVIYKVLVIILTNWNM